MYAVLCHPAGAGVRSFVGEAGRSTTVESGQVYARTVVYRCCLSIDDPCVYVDGQREDQSALACWSLLPRGLRRDVFEPGGTEYGYETRAREARRDHDGRLVSGVVVWKQAGGLLVRVLRVKQFVAAREVVRWNCGGIVGRGGDPRIPDANRKTLDGQG